MDEPVFTARALTKTYRMGDAAVHALRGVDLEIRAGEFIVLLGPSAAIRAAASAELRPADCRGLTVSCTAIC